MWELDHKESWASKNWCFWTVVLEKTLESPLDWRRSNQSILKEINPEYSLDWCWSWSSNTLATWREELTHWKRPWCWEKLKAGGEVDDWGWDGWFNGHEFEQAPGVGDRQWSLACCSPWGCKQLDMTEQLNNNNQFLRASLDYPKALYSQAKAYLSLLSPFFLSV